MKPIETSRLSAMATIRSVRLELQPSEPILLSSFPSWSTSRQGGEGASNTDRQSDLSSRAAEVLAGGSKRYRV